MPTTRCKDCSLKLGFFKKKYHCGLCMHHYCEVCILKVKQKESELIPKLKKFTFPTCLRCVVFHYEIKREHLFLLANKQLTEFLTQRRISIVNCKEKYHLVDLIMNFAYSNGQSTGHEIENEVTRKERVGRLRQDEANRQAEEDRIRQAALEREQAFAEQDDEVREEPLNTSPSENTHVSHGEVDHSTSQGSSRTEPKWEDTTPRDVTENSDYFDEFRPSEVTQSDMNISPDATEDNRMSQLQTDVSHSNDAINLSDVTNSTREDTAADQAKASHGDSSLKHQASGLWCSVNVIKQEQDIIGLTVLELKQILTANFMDYRGCVEKNELVDKVKLLYKSAKKSQAQQESSPDEYEKDICKICMDHTIDCVLLDCGHLVACHECGKRLSHCPVCRSMVARVVHVFRT